MTARRVTEFIHSRNFATLLIFVCGAAIAAAFYGGITVPVEGNRGFVSLSPNLWISNPAVSVILSLAVNGLIALSAVSITKTFNIMRSQTALWAALFAVMQTSTPSIAAQFCGGTILCAVMVFAMMIFYSCYADNSLRRRIFIVFCIVTSAALFQYAIIFYLVVMLPGLAQMRIFNFRTVLAAVLGIITPLWILFGTGIFVAGDLRWPNFVGTLSAIGSSEMILTLITVGVTILLGFVALAANLMRTLSYTAKFRAANGFIAIIMIATTILSLVDYNDLSVYIPILNFTVAYQIAHFFSNRRRDRSYVAVLSVIALYFAVYVLRWLL